MVSCVYIHIASILHLTTLLLFNQASDILRHPYLQPYVNQYRPFPDPSGVTRTPEKPISTSHDSQKSMSDSQNSNVSSSDMDSLHSSKRSTSGLASTSDDKMAEGYSASTDDVDFYSNCSELNTPVTDAHPPDQRRNADICGTEIVRQSMSSSGYVDPQQKLEPKQQKTARNILVALKEEVKARESSSPRRESSSPMRGSRVKISALPNHKINTDPSHKVPKPASTTADQSSKIPKPATTSTDKSFKVSKPTSAGSSSSRSSSQASGNEASKTNSDSMKRAQPSHAVKHMVCTRNAFSMTTSHLSSCILPVIR